MRCVHKMCLDIVIPISMLWSIMHPYLYRCPTSSLYIQVLWLLLLLPLEVPVYIWRVCIISHHINMSRNKNHIAKDYKKIKETQLPIIVFEFRRHLYWFIDYILMWRSSSKTCPIRSFRVLMPLLLFVLPQASFFFFSYLKFNVWSFWIKKFHFSCLQSCLVYCQYNSRKRLALGLGLSADWSVYIE